MTAIADPVQPARKKVRVARIVMGLFAFVSPVPTCIVVWFAIALVLPHNSTATAASGVFLLALPACNSALLYFLNRWFRLEALRVMLLLSIPALIGLSWLSLLIFEFNEGLGVRIGS